MVRFNATLLIMVKLNDTFLPEQQNIGEFLT